MSEDNVVKFNTTTENEKNAKYQAMEDMASELLSAIKRREIDTLIILTISRTENIEYAMCTRNKPFLLLGAIEYGMQRLKDMVSAVIGRTEK